jgi:calpain-7
MKVKTAQLRHFSILKQKSLLWIRIRTVLNQTESTTLLSRERFAFPLPFSDVHGKLALSAKQRQKLTKWARPDEFIKEPTMIHLGTVSTNSSIVS